MNYFEQISHLKVFSQCDFVQDGIALTSPPYHKKTDQRSNEKGPVCLSNELRNGCRKGGVVKK